MLKKSVFFLALFLSGIMPSIAQSTLNPSKPTPGNTSLITPANLKAVTIDELLRRRGITEENPARNVIFLFGTGWVGETASLFRATFPKKLEINRMESMQIVLPEIADSERFQIDLLKLMNGNGRVAGIVSDSGFGCTSRQGLIKAEPGHLFPHLSLSLSVADFSTPEQRDSLVMTFAGRNIEYAKNRSDLDRLFSQKAEKIVGCFRRNRLSDPDSRDSSQPCFDELVTAALSRLSVKNSGFVLLIGSKAAEEARKNGQFADMYEHLLMQEKVLHHINSFVSGQKDTLLLLIQEVHPGTFHFNQKFSLKEFSQKATIIPELVKSLIAGEKTVSQFLSAEDFFDQANSAKIEKFIELKDALGLSAYFQKLLVQKYDMSFEPGLSELSQTSLAVFSQGLGAEILGGLVTYKEFIRRLSLITGIQTQE